MVVQWLRLRASTAGSTGSIHDQASSACHAVSPKKPKKVNSNIENDFYFYYFPWEAKPLP